jgi:hypothetical protein
LLQKRKECLNEKKNNLKGINDNNDNITIKYQDNYQLKKKLKQINSKK